MQSWTVTVFRRHELVWLTARGWEAVRRTTPTEHQAALQQAQGLPLIVRRFDDATPAAHVCLGLPLAPDPGKGQKVRLAFVLDCAEIVRRTPPPTIAEVIAAAPLAWREKLAALAHDAAAAGIVLRVFGSLAWQSLSGRVHVGPQSDIDVLLEAGSAAQLTAGLDLLQRHRRHLPLDGELVLPSGAAVNWREWCNARDAAAGTRVLVKTLKSVRLETAAALLAMEFPLPCAA